MYSVCPHVTPLCSASSLTTQDALKCFSCHHMKFFVCLGRARNLPSQFWEKVRNEWNMFYLPTTRLWHVPTPRLYKCSAITGPVISVACSFTEMPFSFLFVALHVWKPPTVPLNIRTMNIYLICMLSVLVEQRFFSTWTFFFLILDASHCLTVNEGLKCFRFCVVPEACLLYIWFHSSFLCAGGRTVSLTR